MAVINTAGRKVHTCHGDSEHAHTRLTKVLLQNFPRLADTLVICLWKLITWQPITVGLTERELSVAYEKHQSYEDYLFTCEFFNICLIGLNRPIYNARSVFLATVNPNIAQSHLHFEVTLSIWPLNITTEWDKENMPPRHRQRKRLAVPILPRNGPTDTNRCDVTGH